MQKLKNGETARSMETDEIRAIRQIYMEMEFLLVDFVGQIREYLIGKNDLKRFLSNNFLEVLDEQPPLNQAEPGSGDWLQAVSLHIKTFASIMEQTEV